MKQKKQKRTKDDYNYKPSEHFQQSRSEVQARSTYQCACGSTVHASELHACNLGIAQYSSQDRIYSVNLKQR